MEDRNLSLLGRNGTEAGIGITQNQKSIRGHFFQQRINFNKYISYGFGGCFAGSLQEIIRLTEAQIIKENLVKLVVIVLTCVYDDMLNSFRIVEGHKDAG